MEILKNAGKHEVLHWPNNISQIGEVARTCYQSHDKSSPESNLRLVKNLLSRKHEAMIEFDDLIVRFDLVCRGFTHEAVRHRLCSFAQESTRYVDESEFQVVVPGHRDENAPIIPISTYLIQDVETGEYRSTTNPLGTGGLGSFRVISITESKISLKEWFALNEGAYKALRAAGWSPEDARQTLPIAIKSQIVIKANLREWRHIFAMRTSRFAHWEIRRVMGNLLSECKQKIPIIFDDFVEDGVVPKDGVMCFKMIESKIEAIKDKVSSIIDRNKGNPEISKELGYILQMLEASVH